MWFLGLSSMVKVVSKSPYKNKRTVRVEPSEMGPLHKIKGGVRFSRKGCSGRNEKAWLLNHNANGTKAKAYRLHDRVFFAVCKGKLCLLLTPLRSAPVYTFGATRKDLFALSEHQKQEQHSDT